MSWQEIKKTSIKSLLRNPLAQLEVIIKTLINKVDKTENENDALKEKIQKLTDEINRLKGEKGRPDIRPKQNKQENDDDDEKKKGHPNRGKNKKKKSVEIHTKRFLYPDKKTLPKDVQYKGGRDVVIQDMDFNLNNIRFTLHKYYSPSEGKTYEGELPIEYKNTSYGPGIRSFILHFHYEARMTQNILHRILTGFGIQISEGEISNIIRDCKDFEQERQNVREEGIKRGLFQQIDDTGARLNGSNGYSIATCNDYFTDYRTESSKTRLAALKALTGGNIVFSINETALDYIDKKVGNKALVEKLKKLKSSRVYSEEEFEKEILPLMENAIPQWIKYVTEGLVIGAYRKNLLGPRTKILICDDAPQFKDILEYLGLCLIHEERHYKKLTPGHDDFKTALMDFRKGFWEFYEALKEYKKNPTQEEKNRLNNWFDTLFAGDTCYYSLNYLMERTRKKKEELLLVLEFPQIPLHNNTSELAMREKVVQRKIRGYFRSMKGAKASDVFLSLMGSCRKLGVPFGKYIRDRIYHHHQIPSLGELVWAVPDSF